MLSNLSEDFEVGELDFEKNKLHYDQFLKEHLIHNKHFTATKSVKISLFQNK